jgi:hypothetical protein
MRPFTPIDTSRLSRDLVEQALRQPLDNRERQPQFRLSLRSGLPDCVIVRFHEDSIEYVAPTTFSNAERRHFYTNRWLCTRPLFAKVKELFPDLTGSCQLWIDDLPRGPGLAFCGSANNHVCIPDSSFLASLGYSAFRSEVEREWVPWRSRANTVFWRGHSTGLMTKPWPELPRFALCLKAKEINRPDLFDVGLAAIVQIGDEAVKEQIRKADIVKGYCAQIAFMQHRYSIDIDGNTSSWPGLFTKLLMGNTIIKVESEGGYRQWYYDRLKAWENIIPLSSAMTELQQVTEWLMANEEAAEQIADRGRQLADCLSFEQVLISVAPIIRDHVLAGVTNWTEPVIDVDATFISFDQEGPLDQPAPETMENVTEYRSSESGDLASLVNRAFILALAETSEIDPGILNIPGMSGRKYRHFINNLLRLMKDTKYLEIGSWAGSTLCSAINRNAVRATAIDNWSQFGGPKDSFLANVERFRTPEAYVNLIESDFRAVDFASLGTFSVYLYDGPHEYQDQYDGLKLVLSALASEFVFIVDDWNWPNVRTGTARAIAETGLKIDYGLEIKTTLDDSHPEVHGKDSAWHNGYFIAVLSRT